MDLKITKCADTHFPVITYAAGQPPRQRGFDHGRRFAGEIASLARIRRGLMLKKNPALESSLDALAVEQWRESLKFSPEVAAEMEGIREGAGLSLTDIVILNNYTDFRDIELVEEGCTTACVKNDSGVAAGQTWDMHASAKDFLCLIRVPEGGGFPESLVLSLTGCVGLMGINRHGLLIGVNNINTARARAGVIWPLLVREALRRDSAESALSVLRSAKVTSGHNYLVADASGGLHAEIAPEVCEIVADNRREKAGTVFHTNHCLGKEVVRLENRAHLSSTTHERYARFGAKLPVLRDADSLVEVLHGHEGHPKSICSHYQTGETDPSTTCGGGVADLTRGRATFWRGCREYDANYARYDFLLKEGRFEKI